MVPYLAIKVVYEYCELLNVLENFTQRLVIYLLVLMRPAFALDSLKNIL